MRRALRLAALGRESAPNPMVGCVIVAAGGRPVGEGYHHRPGEPHAEVNALRDAAARGADVAGGAAYVTLEPCSHHGRTPPCADALIAAGIARVVVAMRDPDSRVAGQGIARLRAAGTVVEVGQCEAAARALNRAYIYHRETGLPYVTVKTAMTLDGKIATATGDSRWITSPITRLWAHRQLRARIPAILVGVGTVLADDPSLTVRLPHRPGARDPLRVIVDSRLRTPLGAAVVRMAAGDGRTLLAYAHAAPPPERVRALADAGARLVECPAAPDAAGTDRPAVDLTWLARYLGSEEALTGVLVEGGGRVVAGFFQSGLVNRYYAAIAPKIVGGGDAPGPVGGAGLTAAMAGALMGSGLEARRSGVDAVLRCEFVPQV